jgi:hypothetical protein
VWLCAGLLLAAGRSLAAAPAAVSHVTRHALVGAWRLVSIRIDTPAGPVLDPFYGEQCTGLLVYDASGWMSVQISGQNRPRLPVPDSRPTPTETAAASQLKAGALDSYYAYVGTWTLDAPHATLTHHVSSALYPGESGASYTQSVAVQGRTLTLSVRRVLPSGSVTQTKTWQRL